MIIAKIHNVFKNLTDTEQKIASYILEFPEKIVNMTSKELASACGTVPLAVNRMCKSIGVEGFAKLKISLAAAVGKEGYDEKNYPVEAVSARIAHMCAIDALMLSIASLNYEDYSKHISLRNAALDGIRY